MPGLRVGGCEEQGGDVAGRRSRLLRLVRRCGLSGRVLGRGEESGEGAGEWGKEALEGSALEGRE